MSKQVVVVKHKGGCLSGCGTLIIILAGIGLFSSILRDSGDTGRKSENSTPSIPRVSPPPPAKTESQSNTSSSTPQAQVAAPPSSATVEPAAKNTNTLSAVSSKETDASAISKQIVKGCRVKLNRDTPLYFVDSVHRQGVAGEEFEVYDYKADTKKVYLLLHGQDGKPYALNVADEFVTVSSAVAPAAQSPWSIRGPHPNQQEADSFLGITEQQLIGRLGKPLKSETSQSPDGPFKMMIFDETKGSETFFSYFIQDGRIDGGQYRGVALSVPKFQAPPLSAQQLVDLYIKTLTSSGVDRTTIESVSALNKVLTIKVANSWHYAPKQVRLQAAQNLWKLWAVLASPDEPDMARIRLTDLNGNEVGGSRVWGGSLIWVND